jgi:anaerobic magnesium-protoporphyrin IX monomethyl ester cyclase
MKIALIGPELEENLALRYLHAALVSAGHDSRIFDFHTDSQITSIVAAILAYNPHCIGMSMVFTSRAREYVTLAQTLRRKGYLGHITAGGHFASFHCDTLLKEFPEFNTIVHGEAEITLVNLVSNLDRPERVDGISYRNSDNAIASTPLRAHTVTLDDLAYPTRTAPFHTFLGLPIANMLGSRGCFGNCNFCSINAWYRRNKGKRFRQRTVADIVEEMAGLYHDHQVRIFNFHDDNFFLPRHTDNLQRFEEIRQGLTRNHMPKIALQIKARPDSITPAIVDSLKAIGLFRIFLGVESNAVAGLKTLGRNITRQCNHEALAILQAKKIHTTFNLLMFEPNMTPDDFEDNIDMVRTHSAYPINFGRVEVYTGTPLEKQLRAENRLLGDYFGYTYKIKDPRMQQAFEIFMTVFNGRNFEAEAMNLQAMRLDYYHQLLRHFYPRALTRSMTAHKTALIRELNCNSAMLLNEIKEFVLGGAQHLQAVEEKAAALLQWRESYDRQTRHCFSEAIAAIEQAALTRHSASEHGLRKTAVASAAVLVLAAAQCDNPFSNDWHTSEMIATPTDSIDALLSRTPFLPQPTADAIGSIVDEQHRDEIFTITRRYRQSSTEFRLEMIVEAGGGVSAFRLKTPAGSDSAAMANELGSILRQWTFPVVTTEGKCSLIIAVRSELFPASAIRRDTIEWQYCEMIATPVDHPIEWQYCEMIATPVDHPVAPVYVYLTDLLWNDSLWAAYPAFDSMTTAGVEQSIRTQYGAAIDSIATRFALNTGALNLDAIFDAMGKVRMFRVQPGSGAMSAECELAINRVVRPIQIQALRVKGISCKCTVNLLSSQ